MENKLEELLNTLIQRGWKPFGKRDVYIETGEGYDFRDGFIVLKKEKGGTYTCESEYIPYRMLCTKSSGLWQFVCENEMIKLKFGDRRHYNTDNYRDKICLDCNYPYWLMEASLKDESELEDFLLQNIKVDE